MPYMSRAGSTKSLLASTLDRSARSSPPLSQLNTCNCSSSCTCRQVVTDVETTPLLRSQVHDEPISWYEKIPYYIPCLGWIPNYDMSTCIHDLIAGLSLASFQIPLLMSYAKTILHVPPICGLLAVLIPPLVYSIFGSILQLIVGPEPSISIVVGGVIEPMLLHDKKLNLLDLVLVITCLCGFCLFGAGLLRFGFLDTVLSTALLKGFIAAVGVVMICNSSIEEFGLKLNIDDDIHSPYGKLVFVITHLNQLHLKTTLISVIILIILLMMKFFKKRMIAKEYKKVIFIPEILITVIISTYLSYYYQWEKDGISVVGKIHSTKKFYYHLPMEKNFWNFYKPLMSSSVTCAILGFFESTTLSKLLGSDQPISSNRELVALGVINMVAGTFGSLPAFGGYGRSKINKMSGGLTCGSGAFMGLVTIVVIMTCLPMLRYLPNCCLSCITTVVGITILEETPSDLKFFYMTRGWEELITFCITFTFAFLVSMDSGIIMGTSYSIIRILRQISKSRIQILKRVPGTANFIDGNDSLQLEDVENCLIVRIPEPLTFTNTNDLKLKLKRLEMYGSTNYHPATPRFKPHLKIVIFDISEMTDIDSSSAQILLLIIENYHERFIKVYFVSKVFREKIDLMLKRSGIDLLVNNLGNKSIEDVMKLIDQEDWNETASYRSIPNYI